MNKIFISKEIQKILNINKQKSVRWVDCGAVIPYKDAVGRGSNRKYNFNNLLEFKVCKALNLAGQSVRKMKEVLDAYRKQEDEFDFIIITINNILFFKESEVIPYISSKENNWCITINFNLIKKELAGKLNDN